MKHGGQHKYRQGKYQTHPTYEEARQYAEGTSLRIIECSAAACRLARSGGTDPATAQRSPLGLQPEDTSHAPSEGGEGWHLEEGDPRQLVLRQISERRGQTQFRQALRDRYENRCLVTGCEVLAVLEAAHISPYRGESDNSPDNGLLLRADIHTLFDLDLLGIEPDRLQVELHPGVTKEYGHLVGKTLGCADDRRPSREALQRRYGLFRERLQTPHERVGDE
jgi:hypothetical protein